MKTIFIRFYHPSEVMDITPETTDNDVVLNCFRAARYESEANALLAYAETPGTLWSTLLEDSFSYNDIQEWIWNAYQHIKDNDIDWLEENFT